jgi:oxygen-independent coproporphyrinogen-3 oxidase
LAGIYIHIPFCKKACIYCNFHFTTSLKNKQALLDAILLEIELRKNYAGGEVVETIYFGGGTPSILNRVEIERILKTIYQHFSVAKKPEITLEANPENLSPEYLTDLKKTGINRLSIGIQSFRDKDLKYLGRTHSASQAKDCIKNARAAGFKNITIDLIYGIPGLTKKSWQENLNMITELDIPHFSAYSLTVEEKTILFNQINKSIKSQPSEMQARQHFIDLCKFASGMNYEHYEISNFAKKNYISKHNSSYWIGKKYIGLGPSAHSYDLVSRQWNSMVNKDYIHLIRHGKPCFTKEKLSRKDIINEKIMLSLRTSGGLNILEVHDQMSVKEKKLFDQIIQLQTDNGYIKATDNHIFLTKEGMWFSDRIISELFLT